MIWSTLFKYIAGRRAKISIMLFSLSNFTSGTSRNFQNNLQSADRQEDSDQIMLITTLKTNGDEDGDDGEPGAWPDLAR